MSALLFHGDYHVDVTFNKVMVNNVMSFLILQFDFLILIYNHSQQNNLTFM